MGFIFGQVPRQFDGPVEIRCVSYRLFTSAFRHALVAREFLLRLLFNFGWHPGLQDGLGELDYFLGFTVVFAKLPLDCGHLLAQNGFALAFVEYGPRLSADFLSEAHDLYTLG